MELHGEIDYVNSFRVEAKISTAVRTSSFLTIKGGQKRIVLSPQPRRSKPFSKAFWTS
jgi:hypothetical protein